MERKFAEVNPLLNQTGPLIENWVPQNAHQRQSVAKQQKEYLQMFFLVLQVRIGTWSSGINCNVVLTSLKEGIITIIYNS